MHGIQLIKNSLCAWPDHLLPSCPAWVFEKFLLMNSTGYGTQPVNCQRMFRWLCGGRGKARSRWPAYDLRRDALSPKVYSFNVKFSSRGAQSPRWKILELILPSRVSHPKRTSCVTFCEAMQKEPENFLCSAPCATLPNFAVWSEPRGFCRFVFGASPSWSNCSVWHLRDSCFLNFSSRKACPLGGSEGTWRSRGV